MSEDLSNRTSEELEILDQVAEERGGGEEFVEESEELILADAERLNLL